MRVIEVDDPSDPRVADFVVLTDREHGRGDTFVAEGLLVLDQVLATGQAVRSILCTPKRVDAITERIGAMDVPVFVASQPVVDAITGFHLHRGAVAVVERPAERRVADVLAGATSLAVLENVHDIENLGAIFRACAAFAVGGVVLCPRTSDPLYRRVVRVSLGHVLRVPYARAAAWPAAIDEIRDAGFTVIALTPAGDERVDELGTINRPAVLLGSEGPGLTGEALRAADRRVRIAMAPGVDSLNVGTAAAVAFHRLLPSPS